MKLLAAYFLYKGMLRIVAPLWLQRSNVAIYKWMGMSGMADYWSSMELNHIRISGLGCFCLSLVFLTLAARKEANEPSD